MPGIRCESAELGAAYGDDAALVELARQIAGLRVQEERLSNECDRASQIAETMKPERPRTLLWRVHDPVGRTELNPLLMDGSTSRYYWTDPSQVRKLADGPANLPSLPSSKADQAAKERVDELIAAQAKYDAEMELAYERSGYNAAEEALDSVVEKAMSLFEQMLELRPSTIDGLRSLAEAALDACYNGNIPRNDNSPFDRAMAALLTYLTGRH